MAAGGSERLLYCFRYTPLSFDDKVEQDQKQHVVDTLLNTTVSNWKEEGMQVHLEYDLVVFGSHCLADDHHFLPALLTVVKALDTAPHNAALIMVTSRYFV